MAGNASTPTIRKPYEVWLTRDSREHQYAKAYVPSRRGHAEIVLYDWAEYSTELQQALLDLDVTDPWKKGLLDGAYEEFRQRENERRHAAPGDPDDHFAALKQDDPADLVVRSIDASAALGRVLAPVSSQQRTWIAMTLGDEEYSFADIAREEDPDGDEASWRRRANSIGRSVKRGVAKILSEFPDRCPDSHCGEDA